MYCAGINTITTPSTPRATAGSPFGPDAATWRIGSDQSTARFTAATLWGRVPVSGQLGRLRGTMSWDGELVVRGRRHPFACTAAVEALDENRVALDTDTAFDLGELGMSRGLLRMIPADVQAAVRVVLRRERS